MFSSRLKSTDCLCKRVSQINPLLFFKHHLRMVIFYLVGPLPPTRPVQNQMKVSCRDCRTDERTTHNTRNKKQRNKKKQETPNKKQRNKKQKTKNKETRKRNNKQEIRTIKATHFVAQHACMSCEKAGSDVTGMVGRRPSLTTL
jgi:hypothetical protein